MIGLTGLYYIATAALLIDEAGRRQPRPARSGPMSIVVPCVSAALIGYGIVTVWWKRTIQLREHGILRGLNLLRWSHVSHTTIGTV